MNIINIINIIHVETDEHNESWTEWCEIECDDTDYNGLWGAVHSKEDDTITLVDEMGYPYYESENHVNAILLEAINNATGY